MIRRLLARPLDWRMRALTARLDTLAGRAAALDGRMDALDARMDRLAVELAQVRELTAAIPRIAETTAALCRTLDERIQPLVRALADEEADNRRRLHAARAAAGHERAYLEADPLVSVTVATRGRERPLLERALPSLLAQTHANIEIVVVGDAAPDELERAVLALDDPRIRYSNLTQRISAHPDPRRHWLVGSTMARNEAARRARGSWLLHFDDDDHLREDAIASLLALARERRAEVAYGGFEEHRPDGGRSTGLGFPPRLGCFSWAGALVHSGLRFFERELLAAHLELPGDMYMLERMLRAGVRFAALDEVVLDYFPSTLWETPQAKTTTEPGPAPEPRRTPTAAAGRVQFAKDLLGPEHDNPRGGARPRRSYVLCSTPRTGSGLLARALAGTGALGAPLEYFNAANRELLAERWGCGTQLEPYLRAVHASRCSADGVFGAKVHWDQLAGLRAEADGAAGDPFDHEVPDALIERCFPQPTFVRVVRLDVDAQAVSYWRALETGVFSLASDEPTPLSQCPPYDFDGIERARRALEAGELCWERLIRARGAQALVVTYEELTGEYERTVARVAGFISPGLHVVVRAPRTRRLGDTRSLELRERYRAERATRARSDQPTS